MNSKKTLYIGAHADDVAINAGITIHRNPDKAYILTVTNGVSFANYPMVLGGVTLDSHEAYVQQRLEEDKAAMHVLGVDIDKRFTNSKIPCRETYKYLEQIVEIITTLIKTEKIKRIMTHSFPGESHPAHPDHEIVSVCSYLVGNEYGIEVWEYPRFMSNCTNIQTDRIFLNEDVMEIVRYDFTSEEAEFRDELMQNYLTQGFIREKYRTTSEMFGRATRNPKIIPDTTHFYVGADYKPGLRDIRVAITDFLKESSCV